jgi:hypothetical protein
LGEDVEEEEEYADGEVMLASNHLDARIIHRLQSAHTTLFVFAHSHGVQSRERLGEDRGLFILWGRYTYKTRNIHEHFKLEDLKIGGLGLRTFERCITLFWFEFFTRWKYFGPHYSGPGNLEEWNFFVIILGGKELEVVWGSNA